MQFDLITWLLFIWDQDKSSETEQPTPFEDRK